MADCVIITSVVQTTDNPLSYSPLRSIYSHQQRFEQTLETIASVRRHMPGAHILLVECSPASPWMDALKSKVDQFVNLEYDFVVNRSPEKGLGEKTLLAAISHLRAPYSYIYKITGRYVLQNAITWGPSDRPTFCATNVYGVEDGVHTFFYRIPGAWLTAFKMVLETYAGGCFENHVAAALKGRIDLVGRIGILVRWACYESSPVF
jgi:hypothetical protein